MNQNYTEQTRLFRLLKLRKLQRRDIVQIIISLLCALFLWVYISSTIVPDFSRTFKVPVKVDISGTRAEGYELSLLPTENNTTLQDMTVVATIYGVRAEIGALTSSEVVVYVDFDSVTDTIGVQKLPLKLRTTNGAKFTKYELPVEYVDVEMDHYEYRAFPVTVDTGQLTADEGTRISTDKITVDPAEVQIYGPSTRLSQIDQICVSVTNDEPLTKDCWLYGMTDYSLLDKNHNPVLADTLTVQKTEFSVWVPVFYSKTLPVTVGLDNVPDGFDESTILSRLRLTANGTTFPLPDGTNDEECLTITIETDIPELKESLVGRDTWEIKTILLSSIDDDYSEPVAISLSEGYTNKGQLDSVTISVDKTDLETKSLWIPNSSIMKINDNHRDYQYTLESPDGRTPVTLVGSPEDLAKINEDDISAIVDLASIPVTSGTTVGVYPQPLTVTLPDSVKTVWVSPIPEVNIMVSKT